jgi:hypothetical protein
MDEEREHELSMELAAAEHRAKPETHQLRHRAAVTAQRAAVRAFNVFMWDELPRLLDAEIRPEAEAASEALQEALAGIAPIQERYNAIQEKARQLAHVAAVGEHSLYWSQALKLAAEPAPPLPSDEGIATFERARTAPITVKADVPELVTIDAD